MNEAETVSLSTVRNWCRNGEAMRIREAAHLSQREVAESAGTSQNNVSRWERGQRIPRGASALRYGAVLRLIEAARR